MDAVRVTVPATTANLGPGFDCLGMALDLVNTLEVRVDGAPGSVKIEVSGSVDTSYVATTKVNMVYRAFARAFEVSGRACPGVSMKLDLHSPLARGMGSSASAIVSGMAAAAAMGAHLSDEGLHNAMVEMEGHPDNVMAAAVGGLVASCWDGRRVVWTRAEPALNVHCVLVIPSYELSTAKARAAIPKQISHKDAVFNGCRIPLVISSFVSGNLSDLAHVMDDRLHQPYRKPLIREYDLLESEALSAGASAVCISGAGPTVLAVADSGVAEGVRLHLEHVAHTFDAKARVLNLKPQLRGVAVEAI